ncbi:P-loop containing nucleoside triphosphate hydrolase protein, partial [Schizopora paradoxa]
YDSDATRQRIANILKEKMDGKEPYIWQLDVGEAMHMGLDSVVIAGTGAGKTLPFIMPVVLGGTVIIISPLNALQGDQVRRFEKYGLKAVDVNGQTWTESLAKKLERGEFDVILTSPEMCFEHAGFRALLSSGAFTKHLAAIIVDECHVIKTWGEKFRKSFSALGALRSFVPVGVPILATSATLTPSDVDDITKVLEINMETAFFLHRGNDRPNIAYAVKYIKSQLDFDALKEFFCATYEKPEDIPKIAIYIDRCLSTQIVTQRIRSWVPPELHGSIAYFHSHRNDRAKKITLDAFLRGDHRVLIATEAAGMGTDIPDITRVVQFGLPDSLSTWLQRAGRAGRDPNSIAEATLLAEASMFKKQKKRKKKGTGQEVQEATSSGQLDNGANEKKCSACLRAYIETKGCRQDVQDRHFQNPPRTIQTRKKEWLTSARDVLKKLRLDIKEREYLYSSLSADAILPDSVLGKLASKARLRTIEDIEKEINPPWLYARKHGEEVLSVLLTLD